MIFARHALLPTGWAADVRIAVRGGRITGVASHSVAQEGDIRVDTVLPAPSNLHSHTFQRAMAGMTGRRGAGLRGAGLRGAGLRGAGLRGAGLPGSGLRAAGQDGVGGDSFWSWRDLMYRFVAHLTADDVEAIAALAFMEMQEAGFAAVAEFHYLHHLPGGIPHDDPAEMSVRVCAAARTTGIGLTHLPVLYTHSGPGGRPLSDAQRRFGCTPDRFADLHAAIGPSIAALAPDAVLGVAPHSLRAVDRPGLDTAVALAGTAPLHLHIAEQPAEVAEIQAAMGARPVEWLLDHAPVGHNWCAVHATHMTAAEALALARSGAVAGLCPVTEADLGDGPFDGPRWLDAGGRYGIGTDSNLRITMGGELQMLEYSQRLRDLARNVMIPPVASGLAQSAPKGMVQGRQPGGARWLEPDGVQVPEAGEGRNPEAGEGRSLETGEGRNPETGEGRSLETGEGRSLEAGEGRSLEAGEGRSLEAGAPRARAPMSHGHPDAASVGSVLYHAALQGGAQALGRASGAIAPGLWADILAIDTTHPSLCALRSDQVLDGLIFAAPQSVVTDLWSAGRHCVSGGRHVARDAVTTAYRKAMAKLAPRLSGPSPRDTAPSAGARIRATQNLRPDRS